MAKNIKVSKEQYNRLKEAIEDEFSYVTNSNYKPYDGQVNVSANGKKTSEDYGNPVTSDMIQQSITPQSYNRFRSYGNISHAMREGVVINPKQNFYDTANFNNKELDILSNNGKNDNLVKIPQSVQDKLNILLDSVKKTKLSPKQQAIVLHKLIEELSHGNIAYSLKKELINDLS